MITIDSSSSDMHYLWANQDKAKNNNGKIIGIIVGCIVALVLVSLLLIFLYLKSKKKKDQGLITEVTKKSEFVDETQKEKFSYNQKSDDDIDLNFWL